AIFILTIVALKNDPILERNIKMGFDAENGRWQAVIEAHRKIPLSPLNCFYTNMALLKTGQMPEKMFYYDQIGTSGLFLTQEDNFSCYAQSELFWQLGLINEAQHYAYESMIGYSSEQEPNIRNMKRLLNCAMVRQDSALTAKYGKILDKTLFYRNYARKNENQKYPEAIVMKDMLIRNISDVLAAILESDSGNRVIFEYLMAWHMLELDYQKAKNCFDRYYSNFSYPHIPTHYAEFLALYKRLNNLDDDFYEQYPVSRYIRERFDMMDILISTEIDEQIQKALENGFKNTYWFYVRFPLIGVSEKQEYKSKIIY
ncbi:MAG: DUF6057 family protein, partial [Prolixibacteraceae bacterium]|nr:DUF6057 family protein [Prolixibacteraceae bacterium]